MCHVTFDLAAELRPRFGSFARGVLGVLAAVERLLASVRAIGNARSLSDTLNALVDAAGAIAPRAALFIASPASDAPATPQAPKAPAPPSPAR